MADARVDTSTPDTGAVAFNPWDGDPFAAQPDTSEGLVNVGTVDAILEGGALRGSCDRYFGGVDTSRRARLRCGKEMFFWDPLGTPGVPSAIVDFVLTEFADEVGPGFSAYGLIPDPTSDRNLPLGMAPSAPIGGMVANDAFTCASCHFGQLPDGRYAVGAANHAYDYGVHNLAIIVPASLATPGADRDEHHPDALRRLQPLLDHIDADSSGFQLRALGALAPLLGALGGGGLTIPQVDRETEGHYANWLPGTMDFLIAPLPVDDGIHTVSKISLLWGLPPEGEWASAEMDGAHLGFTGVAHSLKNFLRGFIVFGNGDSAAYPDERLGPLEDYIYSLQAPASLTPPAPEATEGEALFTSAGCIDCHDGPRGSGRELYTFEAIGTDDAMRGWLDPELDGTPCCGLDLVPGDRLSYGIKSPRLVGLWAAERFLHNGSVSSLETLFCLDGARNRITTPAYSDRGHDFTCADDLSAADRQALIAYLRSL